MTSQSKPKLYYFAVRGLSEIIRVILAETATDYEEVSLGPFIPGSLPESFHQLKQTGKLAFESVPLWEEPDGFCVVQSQAIVRHLARTKGLHGNNEIEATQCDIIAEGLMDLHAKSELAHFALTGRADPSKKDEIIANWNDKDLPRFLGYFENILQKNNHGTGCLVGNSITFVDLAMWLVLERAMELEWNNLAKFPLLLSFKQRIESRPNIQAWIANPKRYPQPYSKS